MLRFLRRFTKRDRLSRFSGLSDEEYLQAYAEDTDRRVEKDKARAIGGLWDEVGELQFGFLQTQGLEPHNTLLDIGCGTLRAGRLIIPYLERGHYTGFDVSAGAVAAAKDLVRQENLQAKAPTILHVPEGRLDFSFLDGQFDFLLAQSVFTHLRASQIETCFEHLGGVMHSASRFFFTFYPAATADVRGYKSFAYSADFFEKLCMAHDLVLTFPEYDHPRGQLMGEVRLLDGPAG